MEESSLHFCAQVFFLQLAVGSSKLFVLGFFFIAQGCLFQLLGLFLSLNIQQKLLMHLSHLTKKTGGHSNRSIQRNQKKSNQEK